MSHERWRRCAPGSVPHERQACIGYFSNVNRSKPYEVVHHMHPRTGYGP